MSVFQATDITSFFKCLTLVSDASGLSRKDIHNALVQARTQEQRKRQSNLPTWGKVEFKVQPNLLHVDFQPLEPIADRISFEFTVQGGTLALN